MGEQEQSLREALLIEYGELSSGFRFVSTVRLGILGAIPGLVGWMANFIFHVYSMEYTPLRAAIPLSGLIGVTLIIPLEIRMVRMYDLLLARGVDVEKILGITDGTYQRIDDLSYGARLRQVTNIALVLLTILFGVMFLIETLFLLKKGGIV